MTVSLPDSLSHPLLPNLRYGSSSLFAAVALSLILLVLLVLLAKYLRCHRRSKGSSKNAQMVKSADFFQDEGAAGKVTVTVEHENGRADRHLCNVADDRFPRGPLPGPVQRRKERYVRSQATTTTPGAAAGMTSQTQSPQKGLEKKKQHVPSLQPRPAPAPLTVEELLKGQSPQFAPWAYLSWMGADNSLGSTAPTTPDPPYNFAGDSFVEDLMAHYGGAGGGSKAGKVHIVCKGSVTNQVTNKKWCAGVFHGPGVEAHYRSASNPMEFSGDTGFSEKLLLQEHIDSSNASGLRSFLVETSTAFPAQYRCLTLWGHAYAWCPDALLEDRQVLQGTQDPFFMAVEDDSLDSERPRNSLRHAIRGHQSSGGGSSPSSSPSIPDSEKVNVLVFDTCMGMSLENLYLLRNETEILVGNCDYTGWKGVNHRAVGDVLRAGNPAGPAAGPITPWSLAKVIVDNFAPQLDGNINFAIAAYHTCIAVNVREALGEVAFALVHYLRNHRTQATQEIQAAAQSITIPSYTTGAGGNGGVDGLFADATRVMKQLRRNVQDPQVQEKCLALETLLLDSEGQYSYRHATDAFSGLACLNLFFPQTLADYLEASSTPDATPYATVYQRLTFNTDPFDIQSGSGKCSWSAFLTDYFGVA